MDTMPLADIQKPLTQISEQLTQCKSFDTDKLHNIAQQLKEVCAVLEARLPSVLDRLEKNVAALREDWEAARINASIDKEDGGVPLPSIATQDSTTQAVNIQEDRGYSQENEAFTFPKKGESCSDATKDCIGVQESSRFSEQSQKNLQDVPRDNHGLNTKLQDNQEVMKPLDVHKEKTLGSHDDGLTGYLVHKPDFSFLSPSLLPSSLSLFVANSSALEFSHFNMSQQFAWHTKDFLEQQSLVIGATWLRINQIEKSTSQLASFFPGWQKYFEDELGLIMSGGPMVSAEDLQGFSCPLDRCEDGKKIHRTVGPSW